MTGLVELTVTIIVVGLIAWLLVWLIDYVPVPAPFNKVAKVVIMVVSVIIVIYALLGLTRIAPPLKMGSTAPRVAALP